MTAQRLLFGFVDHAHAAASQLAQNAVVADELAPLALDLESRHQTSR